MKGKNSISVNAATVMEALQEYFDDRARGGEADFTVTSVSHEAQAPAFSLIVTIQERGEES